MNRRLLYIGAGAIAFMAIVTGIGRFAGEQAADGSIARLEILWPDVMRFQNDDRAFLAGLAMTCRLHTAQPEALAVIGCLREAAADPNAILPVDQDKAHASARLETLLSSIPDSGAQLSGR